MSTEKKIEDYLHFYLGCRCKYKHQEKKGLINIHEGFGMWRLITIHPTEGKANLEAKGCIEVVNIGEVKPILRPLSDMTEKEKGIGDEILGAYNEDDPTEVLQGMANMTLFLTKSGLDVFGLIESELAIDKTKTP